MTTPEELRRNLIWGCEMLAELSQDAALPAAFRTKASPLLEGYPSLETMQATSVDGLDVLKAEYVEVLTDTRLLFMQVQQHASTTEQRRYSLRVVLRHFP